MRLKKRTLVLLGVMVVAIAASIGAYAYWTSTGTGQGSAATGEAANNIYVRGTSATTLTPGGPSSIVSFTAKNFANFGQSISKIHLASVKACEVPWVYGSEVTYPVPAATCADVGAAAISDANCGTIVQAPAANTPLATDFYMADVTVNPSSVTDGKLAANDDRAISSTGTLLMNNASNDQQDCKNKNLLLTFTTS